MDIKALGEFGLIEEIKRGISLPDGVTGIGDDCAVIPQMSGKEMLVSTDMLIEGTHFLLEDASPYLLGWKSAAVNISDIAAMGGECIASFLSFALPEGLSSKWMSEFIRGYKEVSALYDCPLLGGDTTSSKDGLCISVTVLGQSVIGKSVKRSGAKVGDLICVSGCLGDSACGLKLILNKCERDQDAQKLIESHYKPMPRVSEGVQIMNSGAHAMMDISDGIGSDLRHIMKESGVGAQVDLDKLPLSEELKRKCEQYGWDPMELAICGGEDYELLFTIAPDEEVGLSVPHYVIGQIVSEKGLSWVGSDKEFMGYRHF